MTIDTLREKLRHFGVEDDADFRFDREEAIYWYASDYRAGPVSVASGSGREEMQMH